MDTVNQNIKDVDYYFEFLKELEPNNKLDLISKLSQSLKVEKKDEGNTLQSLFGAYQSDETADEMVADLKNSRVFNRVHTTFCFSKINNSGC